MSRSRQRRGDRGHLRRGVPDAAARLIVTAETAGWARTAAGLATGYATSVIGCDAEAGIERDVPRRRDARRPARRQPARLRLQPRRARQGARQPRRPVHPDLPDDRLLQRLLPGRGRRVKVGGNLRFFGDGFQSSKKLDGRRYWRVPVMDGEFLCEDMFGVKRAVAGGNFLILGHGPGRGARAPRRRPSRPSAQCPASSCPSPAASSAAAARSAAATRSCGPRPTTPTARRSAARAGAACPTSVNAVYEIVIDGLDVAAVEAAMRVGVRAACRPGRRADHRRQLRRQARPVPPAPAQGPRAGTGA